jgi:hypothetical protein
MNIREVSQFAAMFVSLTIMVGAVVAAFLKPHKRPSLCVWFLVGLVDFGFYFWVLLSGLVDVSTPTVEVTRISSIRSLVRTMLISSWLWYWNISNLANKGFTWITILKRFS